MKQLIKKDKYTLFYEPVSAIEVPDYHILIKQPMDFYTMKKKLKQGKYSNVDLFKSDFTLICKNAMTYNAPDTIYYIQANKLLQIGLNIINSSPLNNNDNNIINNNNDVDDNTPSIINNDNDNSNNNNNNNNKNYDSTKATRSKNNKDNGNNTNSYTNNSPNRNKKIENRTIAHVPS